VNGAALSCREALLTFGKRSVPDPVVVPRAQVFRRSVLKALLFTGWWVARRRARARARGGVGACERQPKIAEARGKNDAAY
jgi:hypothetical protein